MGLKGGRQHEDDGVLRSFPEELKNKGLSGDKTSSKVVQNTRIESSQSRKKKKKKSDNWGGRPKRFVKGAWGKNTSSLERDFGRNSRFVCQ